MLSFEIYWQNHLGKYDKPKHLQTILSVGQVSNNTELGAVNFTTLQEATVQKASKYTIWTDENRYAVRKYASEHGNAAVVRHFKTNFLNIKENTIREFKKKYEK